MTFLEMAESVVRTANQPLTAGEIWELAIEHGMDKQLNTKGKTPWATLGARLFVEVRDNPNSRFVPVGKRPTRFGVKGLSTVIGSDEGVSPPDAIKKPRFSERELHPVLVKFADTYHHFRGVKIKTILHEHSVKSKRGFNKWLHPDLVGAYFPFNDRVREYESEIIEFQHALSLTAIRLFSFEVKVRVDMSNLRECYFQAVSNSSWANEGYLVVLKIDDDAIEEVRRLSNSFGIGLIKLEASNVEEGNVLVPAASRKQLDIDGMDRLATENKDFKTFLQSVIDDHRIRKCKSKYDEVLNDEAMALHITGKNIS